MNIVFDHSTVIDPVENRMYRITLNINIVNDTYCNLPIVYLLENIN